MSINLTAVNAQGTYDGPRMGESECWKRFAELKWSDQDLSRCKDAVGMRGVVDTPSSWHFKKGADWRPSNLTKAELNVLETLCRLRSDANSTRLAAAIAVLAFGGDQPDYLGATVYKTCSYAGGMHLKWDSR
ncbi:hypothetical protein IQ216_09425 [Cyanobium sp. LEGE 06143]|uniref:hypothetical protein n=1 Tax=Cyanobium sp. LEGE 06143 TaxID=945727 RepID=UPI0018812A85|nr:hypothetical protein [Cyanobium sp. LEGE 06143]MBE9173290.1 hypothetical protein [Cyanobium sp. LEGE 06143]